MDSDQQQRERADELRERLKDTIRETLTAIQATQDLIDEGQRRRDVEEAYWRVSYVSPSSSEVGGRWPW